MLHTWKRKFYEYVCEQATEQGVCVLKANQELRGLFETPDLLIKGKDITVIARAGP
jgi:hypothetical protein